MSLLLRGRWTNSQHQYIDTSAGEFSLEGNRSPRGAKKVGGREEYRLRVGDYRVLYTIDDREYMVTVFAVGHRREVYR